MIENDEKLPEIYMRNYNNIISYQLCVFSAYTYSAFTIMFLQTLSLTCAWARHFRLFAESLFADPKKRAGQWRIKYKANLFAEERRLINISGIYPEIRNVGVSAGRMAAWRHVAPYMNLLS